MADTRPFKEKFPEFDKELKALIQKYDLAVVPFCERSTIGDVCVIKVVDLNDEEAKKMYGIAPSQPKSTLLVN